MPPTLSPTDTRRPHRALRRRLHLQLSGACAGAVTLVLSCSACGSAAPSAKPDPSTLDGLSAAPVIHLLDRAVAHARTVHFVDTAVDSTGTTTLTGDIGNGEGEEQITGSGAPVSVRLVGGSAYVNGDAAVLENSLNLLPDTAAQYAGIWISLNQGDAPFQQVASSLTTGAELSSYVPAASVARQTDTELNGVPVVALSGPLPLPAAKTATGTVTIDIARDRPFLPLQGSITSTSRGAGGLVTHHETVVFTSWGETLDPVPPAGAITFDAIFH